MRDEPRDVGPFPDFEEKTPARRAAPRAAPPSPHAKTSGGDGGLLTHKNLGNYRRNMVFPAETAGRISARIFLEKRKILENFRFYFAISSCPNYRLLCYGYIRRRYGQI